MALAGRTRLTRFELIDLAVRLLWIAPLKLALNIPRSLVLAFWRRLPLRDYLVCAVLRSLVELVTPRQAQLLMPSTLEAYNVWLVRKRLRARLGGDGFVLARLKRDVEMLPDGESAILWVGNRGRATKFVLFLHGGGYVLPLDPGQLEWCLQAYICAGQETGDEVAVAVLNYSLCPAVCYPVQLMQAADALGVLLDRGIAPRDIIIGGDSCGGNLAVSLLCHVLHPHSGARRIELNEPLAAAFAVSPWLSKRKTGRTFDENKNLDMVSPRIVDQSVKLTLRGGSHVAEERTGKGWAMPIDVDDVWFTGMSNVVKELYVTVGQHECLRDEGIQLAERMRRRNLGMEVRLEVRPKDAHDFILLEGQKGLVGDATKKMKAWTVSVFRRPQ